MAEKVFPNPIFENLKIYVGAEDQLLICIKKYAYLLYGNKWKNKYVMSDFKFLMRSIKLYKNDPYKLACNIKVSKTQYRFAIANLTKLTHEKSPKNDYFSLTLMINFIHDWNVVIDTVIESKDTKLFKQGFNYNISSSS